MLYIYENDYCNKYEKILKKITDIKEWSIDNVYEKINKISFITENDNNKILLTYGYNDKQELVTITINIKKAETDVIYNYNFIINKDNLLFDIFYLFYNDYLNKLVLDLNKKTKELENIINSFMDENL